jgi:tripartite-type tricarboxylate transporter receptor subunit TctC
MRSMLRVAAIAAVTLSIFHSPPARAAGEFNHLVRIIVPYAPGGTSDILARIIAPKLSAAIGQNVIVENKTGAAGNLGADAVAKSPKDGHTLLLTDIGTLATSPALFSTLTFDVEKDLAPVGFVMYAPYVLAVHPSVPAKSVPELLAWSRANPDKVTMANSGVGAINHITALILEKELKLQWKNIPYKGGAAASRAVVSGESNAIINGVTGTMPFVTSGQIVGLAVTGKSRLAKMPNVPTFQEAGLSQGDAGTFQGFFAAGGTPPAVVKRLNEELRKILSDPEIQSKIADQGGEVRPGAPDDLKAWLQTHIKKYGDAIRAADIKVE